MRGANITSGVEKNARENSGARAPEEPNTRLRFKFDRLKYALEEIKTSVNLVEFPKHSRSDIGRDLLILLHFTKCLLQGKAKPCSSVQSICHLCKEIRNNCNFSGGLLNVKYGRFQ